MKTISKRALSVLLAVLMVISVFTVIPLTASADWEDGKPADEPTGGYGVASSCKYYINGSSEAKSGDELSALWDDRLDTNYGQNDWNKPTSDDTATWNWSMVVELPEYVTLKTLELYFPMESPKTEHPAVDENGDYLYLKRLTDVIVETSDKNDFTDDPQPKDGENDVSHVSGFRKDFEAGTADNVKFIKITLKDPKYIEDETYPEGNRPVQWWPAIGQLEIFVDKLQCEMKGIEDLQVRALYKSNKIEWTATDNTSKYVIERKPFGSDDDQYQVINGTQDDPTEIDYVEGDDGKFYYTYLDTDYTGTPGATEGSTVVGGITAQSKDNHTYRITKIAAGSTYEDSASTQQSRIAALEDRSVQALRRNALFSLDFGPYGKTFEGTDPNQIVNIGEQLNDPILIKKLKNLDVGTIGATIKIDPNSSGESRILQLSPGTKDEENSLFYGIESGNFIRFKGNGAGFKIGNAVEKGKVTSFAGSTWPNGHWTASKSGDISEYPDKSGPFTLLNDSITGIYLGGDPTNDDKKLFKGKIYDFIITAEPYVAADYMNIFRPSFSIQLAEAIEGAEEHLKSYGAFSTPESIEIFQAAIDAAKAAIQDLKEGRGTENACKIHYDTLVAAGTLLQKQEGYFSIRMTKGEGAGEISIEHVVDPDREGESDEITLEDPENHTIVIKSSEASHIVKLEATPFAKGLDFVGFFKVGDAEETNLVSNVAQDCEVDEATGKVTYTLKKEQAISEDATIEARFTGFNYGDGQSEPVETTLKKILDDADLITLKQNADSNSANKTDNPDPTSTATNESAGAAFDGLTAGTIWHQNYGSGYGSQALPTEEAPIYIQSGLGKNSGRLIGGIGYVPKTGTGALSTIANAMTTFKVLVDDNPEFTHPTQVATGDFTTIESKTSVDKNGQQSNFQEFFVQFDRPYPADYVRLAATGNNGNNGNYVAANEVFFYEFIGAEVKNGGTVPVVDENGKEIGNIISDAHKVTEEADNCYVYEDEANAAKVAMANDFSTLAKNYTIGDYNEDTQQFVATSEEATYTLKVYSGGSQVATDTKAYGKNFEYTYALDNADTFKFWKAYDSSGVADVKDHIIGVGKDFNYKANENIDIYAEYTQEVSAGAYIPQPVVSRSTDCWLAEIPVSLFKAEGDVFADYGIVVVNSGAGETAAKNVINGTVTEGAKKLSAFDTNLTNKGRYLHNIKFTDLSQAKDVYAYVKVGNEVTLSNVRTIAARS